MEKIIYEILNTNFKKGYISHVKFKLMNGYTVTSNELIKAYTFIEKINYHTRRIENNLNLSKIDIESAVRNWALLNEQKVKAKDFKH